MSDSDGPIPLRLLEDVARRIAGLVPAEAATHFVKAQRELMLGITVLVEHSSRSGAAASRGGRRSSASTRRARRPRRVTID
jgi:hypothetical protein